MSKTIYDFINDFSKYFMIDKEQALSYTNKWWEIDMATKQLTLEEAFKQALKSNRSSKSSNSKSSSKSNSQSNSECSTPRNASTPSVDTSVQVKKTTTRKPKVEKTNTCQYKKKNNELCNIACVDMYCTRHNKSTVDVIVTVGDNNVPMVVKQSVPREASVTTTPTTTSTTSTTTQPPARKLNVKQPTITDNLSKLIESRKSTIVFKMNVFGNYEHGESTCVIDKDTQIVYGKQTNDGTVIQLTLNDVEWCKCNGLNYQLPLKLGEVENTNTISSDASATTVAADSTLQDDDYEELSDDDN